MTSLVINVPGEYISLGLVLQSALEQASKGKGKERHASEGEAYEDQIICEVARRVGLGYPLGQAVKKIYEAQRLGGDRGKAELLGAINYLAAAVIVMKEAGGAETAREVAEFSAKLDETMDRHNAKVVADLLKTKAEGVEELVQKDAPMATQELYQRIVDANPATFKPRKPTGEELAEKAEENPHG